MNKALLANCITLSRILFSILMLASSPNAFTFALLYLLCGVTDVLDGFAARKLHIESEIGEMLDSAADLFFACIYAVKILPLMDIPFWIWIWTVIIAVIKITGILVASKKAHKLLIKHSFGNRFTGILLFLLPVSVFITDVKYTATLVCIAATGTVIKEIANICISANK